MTLLRIPILHGDQAHTIDIGLGLGYRLAEHLASWNRGQKWLILTQQAIADAHPEVLTHLQQSGVDIAVITVPGDESAKTIQQAAQVWTQMVEAGCDRSSVVLAWGGGVVGDLGGFVAATYMRGISVIQLPTTLLAMIDSAIGGKTAVNLPAGKNLVGAIYQPKAIVIDPAFLTSLPKRNVVSSLAEAVKYGLIRDPEIFNIFCQDFDALTSLSDDSLLLRVIEKSCRIKADIVSNDQFESGERMLLNYGHTIGHALETLHDYQRLNHGEAVLYGMRCANFISYTKGLLSEEAYQSARELLARFRLPQLDKIDQQQLLDVIKRDKKHINGKLNFILLEAIGKAVVSTDVGDDDIVASLNELGSL